MNVYVIHYSDLDGEYGNEDTIRIVFPTKEMADHFITNSGFTVGDEEYYKLEDQYSPNFGMDNGCAWIEEYTFKKKS